MPNEKLTVFLKELGATEKQAELIMAILSGEELRDTLKALLSFETQIRNDALKNVGFLRQWLNEKPADKMVTNEDIIYWLTKFNS